MHFTDKQIEKLKSLPREKAQDIYARLWEDDNEELLAELGRRDRFFLLVWILHRRDADKDWIYARCREVEAESDGRLDLWAREHYKSTVITFAGIIQEILNDPNVTVGIFSHTRPAAKKFLGQIMYEFEANADLKRFYPDVLWDEPKKEAPKWSIERGIVVKRDSNPREATVEAWGLVDGMPTGAHFQLRVYDDVVTADSVTTPEMIEKTNDAWALSLNLGTQAGRVWYIGTRYHFNDTYNEILKRGAARERRHPATDDGTEHGKPVLLSQERLEEIRSVSGPYIFSCQQLLSPAADTAMGFKKQWIKHFETVRIKADEMNRYLLCDPASDKKKGSDYTVMMVLGLASDGNYYILDMLRDRLNLTQRANNLFRLHRKWRPRATGYEKYGKDSDIEHYQTVMRDEQYNFGIIPLGGITSKPDRIRRLVPKFEQGKIFLPTSLMYTDTRGKELDLVQSFINDEYVGFPVAHHDDMLDCLARIVDPSFPAVFPRDAQDALQAPMPRKRRYEQANDYVAENWMAV